MQRRRVAVHACRRVGAAAPPPWAAPVGIRILVNAPGAGEGGLETVCRAGRRVWVRSGWMKSRRHGAAQLLTEQLPVSSSVGCWTDWPRMPVGSGREAAAAVRQQGELGSREPAEKSRRTAGTMQRAAGVARIDKLTMLPAVRGELAGRSSPGIAPSPLVAAAAVPCSLPAATAAAVPTLAAATSAAAAAAPPTRIPAVLAVVLAPSAAAAAAPAPVLTVAAAAAATPVKQESNA